MKANLPFKLPRLYIFIIVVAVAFTVLNIAILFWGENIFLWLEGIWSWAFVLSLSLIGAILIGMFISYRLLAFREFTPFEEEMLKMRVEVTEIRESIDRLKALLPEDGTSTGGGPVPGEASPEGAPGDQGD